MGLFNLGKFVLNSGRSTNFKIDCDALGDEDWECLAALVATRLWFGSVEGVPSGGLKFAAALSKHARSGPLLIVDDVLTTGGSMERLRAGRAALGAVVFARGPCPFWVTPVFEMEDRFCEEER